MSYYPVVDLFNDFFNDLDTGFNSIADKFLKKYPSYNVYENDDGQYVYELDVPGFTKEDINIETIGPSLMISGEIKRNNGKTVKIKERLNINEHVCTSASLKNGVLSIVLDKNEKRGTKIEIE